MSAIRIKNTDNDVRNILEHLFKDKALNVNNPISKTFSPYFSFKWGERITKCERGRPMIAAWPDGQNETNNGMSQVERDYFIRLQIVSGGDDEKNKELFFEILSKIKSAFGRASINHSYKTPFIYTKENLNHAVVLSPFKIGALGISQSDILSASAPRRIENNGCSAQYAEILLRWRLYLSIC
jgi:hypothetical protein